MQKTLNFKGLPHRQAFSLAWPMILSNISSPLMGIADTAMLGHLDSALYLGAVAIGANILALLFWMFAFLRMSTTSFVGRALGADDDATLVLHLGQSLLLALSLGLLLIGAQNLLIPVAVEFMAPDPQIAELAARYCHIRIFAAPAAFITYVLIGLFIGLHNARIPLLITVSANLLNIGLDYLLIVVLDWRSEGAAWATLTAEWSACGLAIYLAYKPVRDLLAKTEGLSPGRLFNLDDWRKLAQLNSDLFIRTTLLLLVFNFFTRQSGMLGHTTLAANAIIMQLVLFQSFGLDGYAHAVEAMGAKAVGARNAARFLQACAASTLAAVAMALALCLCLVVFQRPLVALFTDIEAVAGAVHQHYAWLLAIPLVSVWTYLLDGIFIGAGKTRTMRNAMLGSVFFGFLPLWYFTQEWANHGLWASFTFFNLIRGASLGAAFYTLTARRHWF